MTYFSKIYHIIYVVKVNMMKATDYIIEFLIEKGVTDIFGYPGGVICHLIDSAAKYSDKIHTHINYHEQASSFAACGYAQESTNIGVAFSTSGPGATNLVTGIANAYFDSIPTIFFTGQVDTYGLKGDLPIRQRGFQETDIVSMVKCVTKYAVRVDDPKEIRLELEKAFYIAKEGNPGPVLIDLPADVQRAEIEINSIKKFSHMTDKRNIKVKDFSQKIREVCKLLQKSKRPCLIIGNGVKQAGEIRLLRNFIDQVGIPTVFSMPAFDTIPYDSPYNFGFIGANGPRYGNFILGKSDLIISIGSRLDLKQVGNDRGAFAPNARLVRVDIDAGAFSNPIHDDDIHIRVDLRDFLMTLSDLTAGKYKCTDKWLKICKKIKELLLGYDDEEYTVLLRKFGQSLPDNCSIVTDVGQSQVWLAQQLCIKEGQTVHMSAGLGAMGFSLPAAIGVYYAKRRPVYCFNGDGGIQMNLQELQFLARENIPVHVVIINNHALGMIRGFQEVNFNKNYSQTIEGKGYSVPYFSKIADAFGLPYKRVICSEDIEASLGETEAPSVIEINIPFETVLNPNFGRTGKIED